MILRNRRLEPPMTERTETGTEPEIIPPDRHAGESRIWISIDAPGRHRAYMAKPRPLAMVLALLILGILLGVILSVLLGAVLIAIPVAIVLTVAVVASAVFRPKLRRLHFGDR